MWRTQRSRDAGGEGNCNFGFAMGAGKQEGTKSLSSALCGVSTYLVSWAHLPWIVGTGYMPKRALKA